MTATNINYSPAGNKHEWKEINKMELELTGIQR